MVKNVRIKEICSSTLSCEPILRRTQNGELLCVCQCDGPYEPHPDNRVYYFCSADNGETWTEKELIYPEDGNAVYCTEVSVFDDEITAYLTVHSGRFFDWQCVMMKSFDNGHTWNNYGAPPFFEGYTFIRGAVELTNKNIVIPYQHYEVKQETVEWLNKTTEIERKAIWHLNPKYCESGVLISKDGGENFSRHIAAKVKNTHEIIWLEPTVAEVGNGKMIMLMRIDGSGCLWKCESIDGGKSWSEIVKTDIPNPSCKAKLINLENGKIALITTPNSKSGHRYPLSLWISADGAQTWEYKTVLTDFPGRYHYPDGVYENGHILFSIEHNRHTVLFFDVELDV